MRVIDIYAGCGGMGLGFINAGFDILAAYDNWDAAIRVHEKNKKLLAHPMIDIDLSDVPSDLSIFTQFNPDMVIGGPPCQDFSSAGNRNENLGRADLTIVFAYIVKSLGTKWVVMENVDRTLKSNAYTKAKSILREADYGITEKILDASLCGVPQKRKRLFMIGHKHGSDNALIHYLNKNLANKPMTLRDYFGDSLGVECYYRHPRSYQRRAIFSIDEPSPTVRGVNRPIPSTYKKHPGDKCDVTPDLRPLSTEERCQIQTFPKEFELDGESKTRLEQMIGNAVPVKLAEYVANCILEYIEDGLPEMEHIPSKQLTLL